VSSGSLRSKSDEIIIVCADIVHLLILHDHKKLGSFPLIAKANSQARCENFHLITIFEGTRYELAFAMCGKEP
jgi:hypothetical protein